MNTKMRKALEEKNVTEKSAHTHIHIPKERREKKVKSKAEEKTNTDLITSHVECTLNYAHSHVHKIVSSKTTTHFDQFTCKQKNIQMC